MAVASIHVPFLQKQMKLGRRPADPKKRTVQFRNHFRASATPPPDKVDYTAKAMASLGRMFLNDQYGDCVIAGKYHALGVWTGNDSSAVVTPTDQEVHQQYQSICGPGDNGCVITNVLDTFQQRGLPANGVVHKIDGYCSVDWTNKLEVQVALYLFGALTIGINLPSEWANNAQPGAVWTPTRSGIVGGHDVTIVGYDQVGVQISTWGMVLTIRWDAFLSRVWVEECYALLSPDWYGSDKLAPSGVNADTLKADLAALAQGNIPDPGPAPTPVVPPTPTPTPTPTPIAPVYTIDGTVSMPGWFGATKAMPFTGRANPLPEGHGPFRIAIGSTPARVSIVALLLALNQLRKDLAGADLQATFAVVKSAIAHLQARDWAGLQADFNQLEQLVGKTNWPVILEDLAKVAVAIGIPLPF